MPMNPFMSYFINQENSFAILPFLSVIEIDCIDNLLPLLGNFPHSATNHVTSSLRCDGDAKAFT